jgi:7-carboxy-7-deazaguanine synthase
LDSPDKLGHHPKGMASTTLKLARTATGPEVFHSLQGEGRQLGRPSVFVRLSRCNLYCTYCDTPYTWAWQGSPFAHARPERFDPARETVTLSVSAVGQLVRNFNCLHVVLTGGEPMLQSRACAELMQTLRAIDPRYWFEFETNGTVRLDSVVDDLASQFTVSPKLSSSGVRTRHRLRSAVLQQWADNPKSVFKFVVSSEADLHEVRALCDSHRIQADRVYLMPEATLRDELIAREGWVAARCLELGFRYSDRLHVRLYGGGRGV